MSSDLKPLSGFTNSWSQSDSLSNNMSISKEGSSIFSSMWFWLVLILALAFVGFNIFTYLAKGTDILVEITTFFTGVFAQISQMIINMSATGTQAATKATADIVDTSLETVKTVTAPSDQQQQQSEPVQQQMQQQQSMQQPYPTSYPQSNTFPPKQLEPAPASSVDSENKSGWCYVGEQQDFRSCIEVGEFDKCISGDIFPSHEICVNPSLRA